MRPLLLITAVLLAQVVAGQDLTGIWRGSFSTSTLGSFNPLNTEDRYKLEVQVDQMNKILSGVTYSYKTTVFYGKSSASGTVNPATGKVRIEELKIVDLKMQENGYACIMTYYLQYSKKGNDEFLEGKYTSYGEKDSSYCGKGTVYLQRVTTSDFHKEPFLVKRALEKQQKELQELALAEKNRKVPAAKNVPAKTAAKLPNKITGKTPPVVAHNTVKPPVKPALKPVAKTPPVKTPATKAPATENPVAKNSPVKPEQKPRVEATAPALPKPMEQKNIPDIAKADSGNKKQSTEINRPSTTAVPKVLATRENELVRTIVVNTNTVTLNIYDNGTIDHDTVSVYLDNKLVVSKQMLNITPITVTLKMDESNAYHKLVMVAENLGDFPPNTSLMVVKAGDKEYEVRITSTEQKNAVVIFKYQKLDK